MKIKVSLVLLFATFLGAYAQDSYVLDKQKSVLTVSGTSTLHDWEVTANVFDGDLSLLDAVPQQLNLTVEAKEIKSERGATMDKKMYNALKVEEHPQISFVLESAQGNLFKGKLTIAGTTKEVEITSEGTTLAGSYELKGAKEILLADFGIEPPTAMFGQIVVGEAVTISFDFFFNKK